MTESDLEMFFEHSKSQAQFAYFQLGLSASAIAYAVHETEGHSLAATPWPIGGAVLLWGASFAVGCFGIDARQRGMMANLKYNLLNRDVAKFRSDPQLNAAMIDAKGTVQKQIDKPIRRFKAQLYLLFFGAVAYVSGHVIVMARTPVAAAGKAPMQVASSTHAGP